ncbi:MAG: Nif11-like leader peptide family natural product precursor [Chitinophagales bacterium]
MSIESAQAFIERMKTDETFSQKVASCQDAKERRAFLEKAGFNYTDSELKEACQELSDSDLNAVSGGVNPFCYADCCMDIG